MSSEKDTSKIFNIKLEDLSRYPDIDSFLESVKGKEIVKIGNKEKEVVSLIKNIEEIKELKKQGKIYVNDENNKDMFFRVNTLPDGLQSKVIDWLGIKVEVGKKEVKEKIQGNVKVVNKLATEIGNLEKLPTASDKIGEEVDKVLDAYGKAMEELKKLFPEENKQEGGETKKTIVEKKKKSKKSTFINPFLDDEKEVLPVEKTEESQTEEVVEEVKPKEEPKTKEEKVKEEAKKDDFEIPEELKDLKLKDYTPKQKKLMRKIRVEDKTLWEFIKDTIEFSFYEKDREKVGLLEEFKANLDYHQSELKEGKKQSEDYDNMDLESFIKKESQKLENMKNLNEANKLEQDGNEESINLLRENPQLYFDQEKDFVKQRISDNEKSFRAYKEVFEKLKKIAERDFEELEKEIEENINISEKKKLIKNYQSNIKDLELGIKDAKKQKRKTKDLSEIEEFIKEKIEERKSKIDNLQKQIEIEEELIATEKSKLKKNKEKGKGKIEEESHQDFNEKLNNLAESIEDFNELSEGQRFLVLENFKQLFLANMKERSQKELNKHLQKSRFAEIELYKSSDFHIWDAKILNKIRNGIIKTGKIAEMVGKSIKKGYTVAKLEKQEMKASFQNLDSMDNRKVLNELVRGAKNYGPEVRLGKQGEMEIQYAGDWEDLNEGEEKMVDKFNKLATEYSQTPYEWSLNTAKNKQSEKFKEIKDRYEEARDKIINLRKEKSKETLEQDKEKEALLYRNTIEGKIQMNQFLNSNPEVEKEILNIKDKGILKKVLKNVVTERGIYMGAGFVLRSATTAVVGVVALPFAAAGVGAWIANRRAKQNLKEKDFNARYGQKDASKLASNTVDSGERQVKYASRKVSSGEEEEITATRKGLIGKIDYLIQKISDEGDKDEKSKLLDQLRVRLQYTQEKLEDGLVNFGQEEERLNNQYSLIYKLSEANIILQKEDSEQRFFKDGESVEDKLAKLLDLKSRKINKERKKHIVKRTVTGGLISASFATAGYFIRDLLGNGEVTEKILKKVMDDGKAEKIMDSVEDVRESIGIEEVKRWFGSGKEFLNEKLQEFLILFGLKDEISTPQLVGADSTFVKTGVDSDSLGTKISGPGQEIVVDHTSTGGGPKEVAAVAAYEQLFSKKGGDQRVIEMLNGVTDNQDKQSILDELGAPEKVQVAVVSDKQGISQALGIKDIKDGDLRLTIINQDGTVVHGDLNLVHPGDTVFQSENGNLFCKTTSGVAMDGKGSLQGVYDNVAEQHGITEVDDSLKEVFNTDGEGEFTSQMNSQEAENLSTFLDKKLDNGATTIEDYLSSLNNKVEKSQLYDLLNEARVKGESSPDGLGKIVQDFKDSLDLGDDEESIIGTGEVITDIDSHSDPVGDSDESTMQALEDKSNENYQEKIQVESPIETTSIAKELFNQKDGNMVNILATAKVNSDPIELDHLTEFKINEAKIIEVNGLKFFNEDNSGRHYGCLDSKGKLFGEITLKFIDKEDDDIIDVEIMNNYKSLDEMHLETEVSNQNINPGSMDNLDLRGAVMTPKLDYIADLNSGSAKFKELESIFNAYKKDDIIKIMVKDQIFELTKDGEIICGDQVVTVSNINEILDNTETGVEEAIQIKKPSGVIEEQKIILDPKGTKPEVIGAGSEVKTRGGVEINNLEASEFPENVSVEASPEASGFMGEHNIEFVDGELKQLFDTNGNDEFVNSQEAENLDNFLDNELDRDTTIESYLDSLGENKKIELYDALNQAKDKDQNFKEVVKNFRAKEIYFRAKETELEVVGAGSGKGVKMSTLEVNGLPKDVSVGASPDALKFMDEHDIEFVDGELRGEFGSMSFVSEPGTINEGITESIKFEVTKEGNLRCLVVDTDEGENIVEITPDGNVINNVEDVEVSLDEVIIKDKVAFEKLENVQEVMRADTMGDEIILKVKIETESGDNIEISKLEFIKEDNLGKHFKYYEEVDSIDSSGEVILRPVLDDGENTTSMSIVPPEEVPVDAHLTRGELMILSNEKIYALTSALQNGEIKSEEDMLSFVSKIKEDFSGDSELTSSEENTWGRTYESFERNPNSSALNDKMQANMIRFLNKLERVQKPEINVNDLDTEFDPVDSVDSEQISKDSHIENNEVSVNNTDISYDSEIKNADYYNNITKALPRMNGLEEKMIIDVNGKDVEIDKLDLISKVGKVEDGEVTKHFIAYDTDGKEYSFITKEHWNTQDGNAWGVGNKNDSVSHLKGAIEYSIKEKK